MSQRDPDVSKMIVLGSFEGGLNRLIIPPRVIARANAAFDAERALREREASRVKREILQAARARGRLKRALAAVFRRGRRSR